VPCPLRFDENWYPAGNELDRRLMKLTCMAICGTLLLAVSGVPAFAGSKSAAPGRPASAKRNLPGVEGA